MRIFTRLFLAASLIAAGQLSAQDATNNSAQQQSTTPTIVENCAGEQFNDKVSVLEDLIASRVAGKGYSVISRDVAVNALKSYSAAGVTMTSHSGTAVNRGTATDRGSVSMEANAGQKDTAAQGASQSVDVNASQSKSTD